MKNWIGITLWVIGGIGCFTPLAIADALVDLLSMPRQPYTQQEAFEGSDPVVLWEAEGSFNIRFKGLTGEDAVQGSKSFKLDVEFETDGHCIWRIPWAIPLEGDMEQSFQWRTGRHCDAELLGVGYRVSFIPTDTFYRRNSCTVRGGDLQGNPSSWTLCRENFGTPGWPDDSIVSETRSGPLALKIAARVTKYDLGAVMDPLIWIAGKAGQRAVLYLDDLRIAGEAPDPNAYRAAAQARYDAAAAPFHRQLDKWKQRYDVAISGLEAVQDIPDYLQSSRSALVQAAIRHRARLESIIDDGHTDWIRLDPVMDTLWAAERSLEPLRKLAGSQASSPLIHYGIRPISNTTVLPGGMPSVGAIAAPVEVAACRGEYEPACFAVHAIETLEGLTLEVGDLQGPGTIASGAIDPFVLKVWYRSGLYSGDPNGRWLLKDLLLKDDGLVRVNTEEQHNYVRSTAEDGTEEYLLCSGPTSVNLKHLRPVDAETLQPVTVPAGTSKSFWLTVHVPGDATAGRYTGEVTLRWSGDRNPEHRIPLHVTVHDFDLPTSPLVYSVFNRGRFESQAIPGDINSEELNVEGYEREIRNQVEHGVLYPNCYDTLRMARTALEARSRAGVATDRFFCLDFWRTGLMGEASGRGRSDGRAPEWHGHVTPDRRTNSPMEEIAIRIGEWRALLDEFGYGDLYIMGVDEARGHYLQAERPVFELIHESGAKVWAAQTHETTFGIIGDLMDVAVMAGIAKPSEAKKWHGAGKEVFQYGGPMTEWDHPENYRRNQGLVLWQTGYDGMMHYAYRHGFTHVWNDFDHERRDHAFVLPVVDGLIDTIAWEGMREGIDDTRYVAALLEAIDKASDKDLAEQARTFLADMNLAAIMDEVRAEIVDWILRLSDG